MLSTKEPHRHTPAWRKAEGDTAPVYLIRAGSVIERAQIEAELSGTYNAGRVFSFDLLEAFRTGVVALLGDDPASAQLVDLAGAEAALKPGETLDADDVRMLGEARSVLAEHWPAYRALGGQMARRKEVAPILALRRFLVGFENVPVTFARGADGQASEATLGAIDPLELLSAGNFAYGLLFPDAALEGNSQPPSQSGDGQATSTSDAPSAKGGKSPARGGRKTRG